MRTCRVCKLSKDESDFYTIKVYQYTYLRTDCKKCFNKRCNSNGRDKKRTRVRENRKYAIEKLGGKCSKCGFSNPKALHFHHVVPASKTATINELKQFTGTTARKKLDKELEKCVLLCMNCHYSTHRDMRNNPHNASNVNSTKH